MDGEENMQKFVNSHVAIIYALQKSALAANMYVEPGIALICIRQSSSTEPSWVTPNHATTQLLMFGRMNSVVPPSKFSVSSPCAGL